MKLMICITALRQINRSIQLWEQYAAYDILNYVQSKYESENPLAKQNIILHNSVKFLSLDISKNKQKDKPKPKPTKNR